MTASTGNLLMNESSHHFLRPEDARRLANYRFASKMMVEGWMVGRHRSCGRGASSNFLEYRQYAQGDDVRMVDWRVYARTDRHYMKTFEHETRLQCHLFVDSSASMGFREDGPMSKLEYASFFAACFAWLVVRGQDLVSLQLFDDQIRQFLPPGSSMKHLDQMLNLLEHNAPGGRTSLSTALERSMSLLKNRGTLVLVSDFLDDPVAVFRALNPYLHRKFKVILIQVLDPAEIALKDRGAVRYRDVETGEKLVLNTDAVRAAYQQDFLRHRQTLRAMAASRGVLFMSITTRESYYGLFDQLAG